MNHESLRRAAILIASLDTESADALLDEMSADQATLIRNAVMHLDEIDVVEQQEVIREFVGKKPQTRAFHVDGVEILPDLARKFSGTTDPRAAEPPPSDGRREQGDESGQLGTTSKQPDTRPFAFLESVAPGELAEVLSGEHPQTAAIVVAHLTPARAAEVLGHLPREQQADALMRIARLSAPHPDIIYDLEHEMQGMLLERGLSPQVESDGLATVAAILQNASGHAREDLVADIAQQDALLANRLVSISRGQRRHEAAQQSNPASAAQFGRGTSDRQLTRDASIHQNHPRESRESAQPRLIFSDLERMDDAALAQILKRCSSNAMLLAMVDASPQLRQRIVALLPPQQGAELEHTIQHIGPLRLADVQRAQEQLIGIAQQLADEGRLTSPELQRLSVAA